MDIANNVYYFYKYKAKPVLEDKIDLSDMKEYLRKSEEIRKQYY